MYDIAQAGGIPVDADIAASLKQYTNDCVLFELQRPGTHAHRQRACDEHRFHDAVRPGGQPFRSTPWSTGGHHRLLPGRVGRSRSAHGRRDVQQRHKGRVRNAGYNATNAQELTQCTDTLAGVVNTLAGGTGYAATDIFKQMLIGQTMNEVLLDNSPSLAMRVLANRNTGSSLIGAGMAANEWLPVFKAVMTAVGLTLIPFLVIFLPTPLAKKALSSFAGSSSISPRGV